MVQLRSPGHEILLRILGDNRAVITLTAHLSISRVEQRVQLVFFILEGYWIILRQVSTRYDILRASVILIFVSLRSQVI